MSPAAGASAAEVTWGRPSLPAVGATSEPSVSVVVPTLARPAALARCLAALGAQERPADEVVVVARRGDDATWSALPALLARLPGSRAEQVGDAGQVAALNRGLAAARGDVVAFTDDDAEPAPDWVARIARGFAADPLLGALGGRDRLWIGDHRVAGRPREVGRVRWYGRVIGNHHLGTGPARLVESLKGANLSVRRAALAGGLRFDERLRGEGAQYRNDLALCLAIRRGGWRVVYDPALVVEHRQAARAAGAIRGALDARALRDEAHNTALCVLEHLPAPGRLAFLAFALLVGTFGAPGVAQALRRLPRDGLAGAAARLAAAWAGLLDGWRTCRLRAAAPQAAPAPAAAPPPAAAPSRSVATSAAASAGGSDARPDGIG